MTRATSRLAKMGTKGRTPGLTAKSGNETMSAYDVRTSIDDLSQEERTTKTRELIGDAVKEIGFSKTLSTVVSARIPFMDRKGPPDFKASFWDEVAKEVDVRADRHRIASEKFDRRQEHFDNGLVEIQGEMIEFSHLKSLEAWALGPLDKIERPDGSLFHKLKDGWANSRSLITSTTSKNFATFFATDPHVFVVEHDWEKAFAGAKDFDGGEWPYPYDRCAFEFQVNGRRAILLAMKADPVPVDVICFQIHEDAWTAGQFQLSNRPDTTIHLHANVDQLEQRLRSIVRAICIALDAEVAVTKVTRAPHRLNSIRERQGRLPLMSYHTVDLAKRSRVEALPRHGDHPANRKRLHFRRGHWRHFAEHKTWIRWMLVGNPDLGFIDKHYRA